MLQFALRRAVWTVPVLVVCLTILFGLMRVAAQDPVRHAPLLGLSSVPWVKYGDVRPESIDRNMRRRFGIDGPWYEQYAHYMEGVARFDFGQSYTYTNRTVNSILYEQGRITLELVALALGWAVAAGIALGVAAARWRGRLVDRAFTVVNTATMGIPLFFLGTFLVWLLAVKFPVVPVFGWDGWRSKLLPAFVLGLLPLTVIARVVRFELLEVFGRDHLIAARAKGLRRRRLLWVHSLRPALIPVLSITGPLIGQIVTGLFVVEWIFSIPGIGRYFTAAAVAGDYPLTFALTAVLTMVILGVNLLSDIALAALDPRTRSA